MLASSLFFRVLPYFHYSEYLNYYLILLCFFLFFYFFCVQFFFSSSLALYVIGWTIDQLTSSLSHLMDYWILISSSRFILPIRSNLSIYYYASIDHVIHSISLLFHPVNFHCLVQCFNPVKK